MDNQLNTILTKYFSFDHFWEGQLEVIKHMVNKQSACAIFPTGAGKSLCYQLPSLLLENMTIVISPLLSLMKDQVDFLKKKNIPAEKLDSTLTREQYNDALQKAKEGKLKILMISVERFKNERFRTHLKEMKISLLVVDEAHCISEWGHNFRPEYLKIPVYKAEFNIRQILLLTATATPQVVDEMCQKFDIPKQNVIITGFYRNNLHLHISPAPIDQKDNILLKQIVKDPTAPTIVYVTLQKTAEVVAQMLTSKGIIAHAYHAGMNSQERETVQDDFMNGKINVVTATIAFGMGIDKKNIRRIIHYNLPKSLENYSQEIGRAGRDGNKSLCLVLADKDNINVLENFVYGDTPEIKGIKIILDLIKKNPGNNWEVSNYSLTRETNIRLLPLKTLLVYLELMKIILPRYTYFQKYSFKLIENIQNIINRFQGERRQLVQAMFDYSQTKKIWTTIDINSLVNNYSVKRERVIKALEYFDQNQWIELKADLAVDVFEILTKEFDVKQVAEKLTNLFKKKEKREIQRIHQMVRFFENDNCISRNLSLYFGEDSIQNCGHCSLCLTGKIIIPPANQKPSLSNYQYNEITLELYNILGEELSTPIIVKYLCGISTPFFSKNRITKEENFGVFQNYPYNEVESWVLENNVHKSENKTCDAGN